MSDDLIAFFRARLDEDEQVARAAPQGEPWGGQWKADGDHAIRTFNDWVLAYGHGGRDLRPGFTAHVARWDPARVLADVEAKRRIAEQLRRYEGAIRQESANARPGDPIPKNLYAGRDALREAVRLLALPYAEHGDFREEWRA